MKSVLGREVEIIDDSTLMFGLKLGMRGIIREDEGGVVKVFFPDSGFPDVPMHWNVFSIIYDNESFTDATDPVIRALKYVYAGPCADCDHEALEGDYLCGKCREDAA